MDSVTSYGSGGSEEALLASDASFASSNPSRLQTSPRRTNRENLPLLRGRGHQRLQDYEDIDLDNLNVFTGEFFTLALTITLVQPCIQCANFRIFLPYILREIIFGDSRGSRVKTRRFDIYRFSEVWVWYNFLKFSQVKFAKWKSRASRTAEMAFFFNFLNPQTWLCKIWIAEKLWNFHTVL